MPSEIRDNFAHSARHAEVALTAQELSIDARIIAGHREGDTVATRIRRLCRITKLSHSQARRVWYGEIKDPKASVIDAIANAKPRNEAIAHAEILERAARSLESIDPDFHRTEIDRLRDAARKLRGVDAGEGQG